MANTNHGSNLRDNPPQSMSTDTDHTDSAASVPGDYSPEIVKRMLLLLGNTDQPMLSYIWRAWLIALIPSLALSAIVTLSSVIRGTSGKNLPMQGESPWEIVFGGLIVSPWFETLLMWPILGILKDFTKKPLPIALASGLIWGGIHSLAIPSWGLIVWWPFVVFSLCFLAWKQKSLGRAITVTALVHTCLNTVPVIVILLHAFFG